MFERAMRRTLLMTKQLYLSIAIILSFCAAISATPTDGADRGSQSSAKKRAGHGAQAIKAGAEPTGPSGSGQSQNGNVKTRQTLAGKKQPSGKKAQTGSATGYN